MNEDFAHGAIRIHPLHRRFRRGWRKMKNRLKGIQAVGRGIPVDWATGYDVRNQTGAISIKNQGTNSSCGGQAQSYGLEIKRRLQGIKEGAISSKSMYEPASGGGMTINSLINQFCFHGGNLEASVASYDALGRPLNEAMMEDASWKTPELINDALVRAGYTPYDVPKDIDSVAQAIQEQGFVIIEIEGQNGHVPGWESPTPQVPSPSNPNEVWNHYMACVGFKMIGTEKHIVALQSMGDSWGLNGVQFISQSYFDSPYILDRLSFLYDASLIPNPDNNSIGAQLLLWFRRQFILWNEKTV